MVLMLSDHADVGDLLGETELMSVMQTPSSESFSSPNGGSTGEVAYGDVFGVSPGSSKSLASPTLKRERDEPPLSDSSDEDPHNVEEKRRQPGVKRACNECRQQKLRCDVIQKPAYAPCSRCRRLRLDCRIDSNFRRVGKRSRNAEMEKEIMELRRQLAEQGTSSAPSVKAEPSSPGTPSVPPLQSTVSQYLGSQDAAASLMDLKSGFEGEAYTRSPSGQIIHPRCLGEVVLSRPRQAEMFNTYFSCYHQYLPLLDPMQSPDDYFDSSVLLFWVIVSVAARQDKDRSLLQSLSKPLQKLLWSTVSDVPQSHVTVKAFCLLLTWPLPISSSSSDPTFMLTGLTIQTAMQIGLHKPSHAQDFSRFRVELREEELKDRVRTWAACSAVAQRVATGYGQPPMSVYDWILAPTNHGEEGMKLPVEVEHRLSIERLSNRATKALYGNEHNIAGIDDDDHRSITASILAHDFRDLEKVLRNEPSTSTFTMLYFHAACLHLHLSAFFAAPSASDYRDSVLNLWFATRAFLECSFNLGSTSGSYLIYATNYILQMMIAAGFTLLKILNSSFAQYIDKAYGRNLFSRTIYAIRSISVLSNDLPDRLAEVLAQLWKGWGAGSRTIRQDDGYTDTSLQLKVRCRMSMSLVYDTVWRWREEYQASGRGNLEAATKNPTRPESNPDSSASSVIDSNIVCANGMGETLAPPPIFPLGDPAYEVFDPLNWMLDGDIVFPGSHN